MPVRIVGDDARSADSGSVGHLHICILLLIGWTSGGGSACRRDEYEMAGTGSTGSSRSTGRGKHRRCCRKLTLQHDAAAAVFHHLDTTDDEPDAFVAFGVGEVGLVLHIGEGVALGALVHEALAAVAYVIMDEERVGRYGGGDEAATDFQLSSKLCPGEVRCVKLLAISFAKVAKESAGTSLVGRADGRSAAVGMSVENALDADGEGLAGKLGNIDRRIKRSEAIV